MCAAPVRRVERVEVVWLQAQERHRSTQDSQLPVEALALSRAAHHNATTLAHALGLGRATLRRQPGDKVALGGVHLLERAIAFLHRVPQRGPGLLLGSVTVPLAVIPGIAESASMPR